jgi:hypothetical protein
MNNLSPATLSSDDIRSVDELAVDASRSSVESAVRHGEGILRVSVGLLGGSLDGLCALDGLLSLEVGTRRLHDSLKHLLGLAEVVQRAIILHRVVLRALHGRARCVREQRVRQLAEADVPPLRLGKALTIAHGTSAHVTVTHVQVHSGSREKRG